MLENLDKLAAAITAVKVDTEWGVFFLKPLSPTQLTKIRSYPEPEQAAHSMLSALCNEDGSAIVKTDADRKKYSEILGQSIPLMIALNTAYTDNFNKGLEDLGKK